MPPCSAGDTGEGTALRALAAGVVLLGAGATAAGFLGPRWWPVSVLGNLRPQLTGVLGLAAVASARARSWPLAGLATGSAVVNATVILPLFVRQDRSRRPGPELRIAALNVLFSNTRYDDVVAWVRGSAADVVVLVEASDEWARRIPEADLPFTVTLATGERPGDGMLVLTRQPPLRAEVVSVGPRPMIEVVVEMAPAPVRVLAVHPHAPTSRRGARWQVEELRWIAAWAARQAEPAVVVGDLNATRWYPGFQALLAAGLTESARGFGWRPTWPARGWLMALSMPLDHVLHTSDLVTVRYGVGPSLGSDHRAVDVTLNLRR